MGDGVTDDYNALSTCLTQAHNLAIPVVNTGGGVILNNTASIAVPEGMELTCGGNNSATVEDDDYRIGHGLTNAIVIDPAFTVALSSINSSFVGCKLLAGPGMDDTNPYSPAVWYPKCIPTDTPVVPCDTDMPAKPYLRSATNEYSAFNPNLTAAYDSGGPASSSVGITVTAENAAVRNVTVLGFGTCYTTNPGEERGGIRPVIDHLDADCDTGMLFREVPSSTEVNGFVVTPFLTRKNKTASISTTNVRSFPIGAVSIPYRVEVENPLDDSDNATFTLQNGDTVWIGTTPATGAESAAGRWTVHDDVSDSHTCYSILKCQTFDLAGTSTTYSATGEINASGADGVPATAITMVSANLEHISVGQGVTDHTTASCLPAETKVVDVWPAQKTVYLSAAATCTGGHTFEFADQIYTAGLHCSDADNADIADGCATATADIRFGDGVRIENSAGITVVNCQTFEHVVGFHMSTGANNVKVANCSTGENQGMPDGEIIGLKIDGDHATDDDSQDACDISFINGHMGQHRPVSVFVDSDCSAPDKLTNLTLGPWGHGKNGIVLEIDAGAVLLENSSANTEGNLFKAEGAQLNVSNNAFPASTLYVQNDAAAAGMVGCGNVFDVPTAWLCPAPPPGPPGGRLSLSAGAPVMTSDVTGASSVYYLPYVGRRVPIYHQGSGGFVSVEFDDGGLTLPLDATSMNKQLPQTLYDIFVQTISTPGVPALCVGMAWASSSARDVGLKLVSGVWVNAAPMGICQYGVGDSANVACPVLACTYLGTMYTTDPGKTSQEFGPVSQSGGGGNCLCLYNAYNHVTVVSQSLDSAANYAYATNSWRPMDFPVASGTGNRITVVDGLQQMAISAILNDAVNKNAASGGRGDIGIDLNSTTSAPAVFVDVATTTKASYQAVLRNPPKLGLWYAQAMENAPGGLSAQFGGSGLQQLSVQVED